MAIKYSYSKLQKSWKRAADKMDGHEILRVRSSAHGFSFDMRVLCDDDRSNPRSYILPEDVKNPAHLSEILNAIAKGDSRRKNEKNKLGGVHIWVDGACGYTIENWQQEASLSAA